NEVVEDIPPQQDDTKNTKIGTETTEGEETGLTPIEPGPSAIDPDEGKVFTFVEQNAEYPGGEAAMMAYLGKNIRYPEMEKEAGIQGTVILTFVVEKDGNITDVKEVRGVKGGTNLTKEAIRVVKTMPQWRPGKMNGKSVRVQFNLPVRFTLR
ncbi:MAG: energy transducer TonB, partial [Bacteroidota bacterium]